MDFKSLGRIDQQWVLVYYSNSNEVIETYDTIQQARIRVEELGFQLNFDVEDQQ